MIGPLPEGVPTPEEIDAFEALRTAATTTPNAVPEEHVCSTCMAASSWCRDNGFPCCEGCDCEGAA